MAGFNSISFYLFSRLFRLFLVSSRHSLNADNIPGKGDLVGCDISMHLVASSNGQGGSAQHGSSGGQDVLVKSSSDVKVWRRSTISVIRWYAEAKSNIKLDSWRLFIYWMDAFSCTPCTVCALVCVLCVFWHQIIISIELIALNLLMVTQNIYSVECSVVCAWVILAVISASIDRVTCTNYRFVWSLRRLKDA